MRVVESKDGMTADWVKLPYEVLEKMSNRIINEVNGANRVCLDISASLQPLLSGNKDFYPALIQ